MAETTFKSVTRFEPCEICGGDHKCSRGADGVLMCGRPPDVTPFGFVYLKRAKGDEQFALYRRDDDPRLNQRNGSSNGNGHHKTPSMPPVDWEAKANEYRRNLTPALRRKLALELGLPESALESLLIGYRQDDFHGPCWTFAEVDGEGKVIGINRRYHTAEKKLMSGGRRGLTVPAGWRDRTGPLFLPEGASCVLAFMAMGLRAIGRPNNTAGAGMLAQLLRGEESVIAVVGEWDVKETGEWPGKEGAIKTAQELANLLGRELCWVLPPERAKDARAWVTSKRPDPDCADAWQDLGEEWIIHAERALRTITPVSVEHVEYAPTTATPIERFTIAELLEQYPRLHQCVIDGLLRERETANIVSVSKVGKSWLAYGLALSIVTGRPWLERFGTSQGRVLLIDNELHKPTIAYRIKAVADALAIPLGEYKDRLEVWPLRGNLRNVLELRSELEHICECKAVILDAKYRMIQPGTSENDNAAETRFYNEIDQYAEETGAAFINVHHSSKGFQGEKRVTDVGAGAGAQSRAADSHLVLREHEEDGVVVLEAAVRSFAPVEPLALRWVFPLWVQAGEVDPTRLRGRLTQQEQRQVERDRQGMSKILDVLEKGPTPMPLRRLRDWVGIGPERLSRLLGRLETEEKVKHREINIRGNDTREYWPARETEKQEAGNGAAPYGSDGGRL